MNTVFFIIGGLAVGFLVLRYFPGKSQEAELAHTQKRLEEAKEKAAKIRAEAKEKVERMQRAFAEEETSTKESVAHMESMLKEKEDMVKRRTDRNKSYAGNVKALKKEIQELIEAYAASRKKGIDILSKASKLTPDAALKQAQAEVEELVTGNKDKRNSAELEEFEEEIMRHAKAVLQVVIQRLGVPSSVDKNHTSVVVRDDKFKGMLIGKGGANVKYLEELLPVSLIFNLGDTFTLHVGGVNLLRRNIAKRAIMKLQKRAKKTKKIDHDMIKKAVEESEANIMKECDDKGRWALKQMKLDPNKVPAELVNYVGRMYFRTSYGQNIIHHSLEMAYAARLIAELIDVNVNTAMQAAFYHDIGKAIDHDVGGAHDDLSKEILEKHGYDPAIVHAAYAHHDKVPCLAPEDFIVKAVDAISGGRPGARMESVTNYFERMKQLEGCAKAFDGVQKVLTMSAGREVRVMVNKDHIKDGAMQELGDKIAEKISDEVSFPGIIKVNLIRRTKAVDYAKEARKRY